MKISVRTGRYVWLVAAWFVIPSMADDQRATTQAAVETAPADLGGAWRYRSFFDEPKHVKDVNSLLFGEADLVLEQSPSGVLTGSGDFGGGNTMKFQGLVTHDSLLTVRFQGIGTGTNNKDWFYDYVGVLVPHWSNGLNQVPVLVGSVVRSAPHSNGAGGTLPAGRVASFIAIKN